VKDGPQAHPSMDSVRALIEQIVASSIKILPPTVLQQRSLLHVQEMHFAAAPQAGASVETRCVLGAAAGTFGKIWRGVSLERLTMSVGRDRGGKALK